jgi:hypothetical protein
MSVDSITLAPLRLYSRLTIGGSCFNIMIIAPLKITSPRHMPKVLGTAGWPASMTALDKISLFGPALHYLL